MKMSKKPRGNIHKIREFELEKINLVDEFDILQIVGEGWFGKILLVEHRASQTEMVLKAVPKPYVSLRDFYREFHYGLHLGIHRNIVTTYDVAFETAGFYIFTQEYAPLGDLTSNVTETGVGEVYSKRVAKQIAAALDYMHSKDIVHRDVKLDNVLIYRSDFSRIKLCDFGESYQSGTVVERRNEWLPYSPPEVLEIKPEGTYKADPSHDVWQFGIVIFVCLTGCLPWQKAASDDPRYMRYLVWQGSMILPIRRTPKLFKLLSSRAQRMFRRFLEPRPDRRPKNLSDLTKFLDDRWLAKTAEKEMAEYETDELCPSMYSFHSSPDEKHRLLYTLADCGIETNVDRQSKKNRIKDWIESSVITEEDEDEYDEASPSSSVSREPVAGHISSIRATVEKTKEIKTTLKDANQKHFDPRTGALQQGPSEMGATLPTLAPLPKSTSPSVSNVSMLNNGDSLCGSLLTINSAQNMSNLQIYNSDININHLGEQQSNISFDDSFLNQSLSSSSNVLMPPPLPTSLALQSPNSASNFFTSYNTTTAHKAVSWAKDTFSQNILQRSKTDSLKATMYASTPAIINANAYASPIYNATTITTNQGDSDNAPNRSLSIVNTNANNTNSNTQINGPPQLANGNVNAINKPVALAGLTNAFQTLAQVAMPADTIPNLQQQQQQKQQQHQQSYYFSSQQKYDSQIKDSAYGSTEVHESPAKTMNGLMTNGKPMEQRQQQFQHLQKLQQSPVNRVHTQTSQQQQRMYTGAATNTSLKDTAYDRVIVTNKNSSTRKRR